MHRREMLPVIRRSVQVGVRVNALRDERRRVLNVVGRGRLAFQRFFRGCGAIGVVRKAGNSDALQVGETALAIGSPFGLQGSFTAGIISGLNRSSTAPTGRGSTNGAGRT